MFQAGEQPPQLILVDKRAKGWIAKGKCTHLQPNTLSFVPDLPTCLAYWILECEMQIGCRAGWRRSFVIPQPAEFTRIMHNKYVPYSTEMNNVVIELMLQGKSDVEKERCRERAI